MGSSQRDVIRPCLIGAPDQTGPDNVNETRNNPAKFAFTP